MTTYVAAMRLLLLVFVPLLLASSLSAQPLPMGVPDLCAGSPANVAAGATRTITGAVTERCLGVHGTLILKDADLSVETLLIYPDGALECGSPALPCWGQVRFTDAPLDAALDPEQYGHGLVCFGRCRLYGQPKTTFTRLAVAPMAGATQLTLNETPMNWHPGDRLVIPESRQRVDPNWNSQATFAPEWETPIVLSVAGAVVTLTAPLRYAHPGAVGTIPGVGPFLPHAGNLTRSMVFRSTNPNGVRGHTIAMHRADVDTQYIQFQDLGRTTIEPLDSWAPGRSATNQIGRYALHLHHVIGADPPTSDRQFRLVGNAVVDSRKWGIGAHNSSYGLVQDNVVYNADGASFMFEDGQEAENDVVHNFAVRTFGTGGRSGEGREGSGFYFRGPLNRVRDNVAANFFSNGPDAAFGYKYYQTYLSAIKIPIRPGADTTLPGQAIDVNGNASAIAEFRNNEAYAGDNGLTFWWVGTFSVDPNLSTPRSVFDGLKVWHIFGRGIFQYESFNVTVKDYVALNTGFNYATGYTGGDNLSHTSRMENPRVENFATGLSPSFVMGSSTTPPIIVGGVLKNALNLEVITLVTSSSRADGMRPMDLVIDGTRFEAPAGRPLTSIQMLYGNGGRNAEPVRNLIQRHTVTVRNYQGVAGQDFRVYFPQQADSFLIPPTHRNGNGEPDVVGAPVAGLTNAQAWAQYGIAIAGAVAPCTTTRPEILGFVCGASGPPIVPPVTPPPTVTLTVAPLTIAPQESATLTWTSTNATVTITPGLGTVPASGSRVVTPTVGTTYTASASNAVSTAVATARVDITIIVPPPPTLCTDKLATNVGKPLPCAYPPVAVKPLCSTIATLRGWLLWAETGRAGLAPCRLK